MTIPAQSPSPAPAPEPAPEPRPTPVLVSWSSGKDSAWALHSLRSRPDRWHVRGIFTTVNATDDRVAIQATPRAILQMQADRLGLPLYEIPIPNPCPNQTYEAAMAAFLDRIRSLPPDQSASTLAFGDLFLEDIRKYRETALAGTGFTPVFPIWGRPTAQLAERMIAEGLRAIATSVSGLRLPRSFAGRWFDRQFLADLPPDVDPLGENGEFHTCVIDGPMLSTPIPAAPGRIISRPIPPINDDLHGSIPAHQVHYADIEFVGE